MISTHAHMSQRGFALLIAVILSAVSLTLAVSLLDIAYKQVVLAGTAKQSQEAFYVSDTAMECALYYDQQLDAFNYTTPLASGNITCHGQAISGYSSTVASGRRTTSFAVTCPVSGTDSLIQVYKQSTASTTIYATGYSSCDANDPRRIERGFKVFY